MPVSNPDLWTRIEVYFSTYKPLPSMLNLVASDARDFEDSVAQSMSLSKYNAERLVLEYKRYLYLKAIDGGLLSPPPDIDKLWHKHLENPKGEWTNFCDKVVGKRLEHRTGLSRAELREAREKVHTLYLQEFGHPPTDIWPDRDGLVRYRISSLVKSLGAIIFLGSLAGSIWTNVQGNPLPNWLVLLPFVAIGIVSVGSAIGKGTQVQRESNCA